MAARCGGVRVHRCTCRTGEVESEHYEAKLEWLGELRSYLGRRTGDRRMAVCGDFNIAPEDRDIAGPGRRRRLHPCDCSRARRPRELRGVGAGGCVPAAVPEPQLFTWWDYSAGNFHKHMGMRIDLVLLSRPLSQIAARTGGPSTATPARGRDLRRRTALRRHRPVRPINPEPRHAGAADSGFFSTVSRRWARMSEM